ncbi:MAG: type II toxin-antitoxin system HicB family antitoxin [Ignavibacteriales bacterium]|nr:type II toxin-antitoxin system HicB family antitoxin [Ignavibacteriales bacterium]
MTKNLSYYLSLDYPITIERMEDKFYSASIPLVKGCKGYGPTPGDAMEELAGTKEALFAIMLRQHKSIPEPTIKLEIPVSEFSRIPNKKRLQRFVQNV